MPETNILTQKMLNGSHDVYVQDQTTDIIDLYFIDHENAVELTLAEGASVDAKTVTVMDATGVTAGDAIEFTENAHVMQAVVLDVTGAVITFNAPLDKALTTACVCVAGKWDMVVDGSTTTKTYSVKPPSGVKWDITRIMIGMTASATMDDSKFGSLTALTNGIVLRRSDSSNHNIFVASDNGGLAERMYDAEYPDKVPAGVYAFRARRTFAGQDKNGVVIRLDGDNGDELQLLIQDNLSGGTLTKFAVVAQGHEVDD